MTTNEEMDRSESGAEADPAHLQPRLLVAAPSGFTSWVERAFIEGADGGGLAFETARPSRAFSEMEGERRYFAGISTRSRLPNERKAKTHSVWLNEASSLTRFDWNRWVWEQEQTTNWIETPPQKQMTALETICRNAHWSRPVGGILLIGSRTLCLPFAVGPVDLIPEPADPYAALCGCCRATVGFAATEITPDEDWID